MWVFWARRCSPSSPPWQRGGGPAGCSLSELWRDSGRWGLSLSLSGLIHILKKRHQRLYLQGVTYPAMMAMWARWAPPLERSRLMTLSGSGGSFGAFVALPLTGFLCEKLGWPAVFYLCGA